MRDRRFPQLATWFNAQVTAGSVLICDLVVLELTRLAPNERRAREVSSRLGAFASVPMATGLWPRTRELQLSLADAGEHRRVPPADLLLAAAAEAAAVPLVHYDADYVRIAQVSDLEQRLLAPLGALA